MVLRHLFAILLIVTVGPSWAAEVGGLRVWSDPEKTRAVLDLSDSATYQLFSLQNPNRVVIDLKKTELASSLGFQAEYAGVIDDVRSGNPESDTLRIVLDLNDRVKSKSFMLEPTGQVSGEWLYLSGDEASNARIAGTESAVFLQRGVAMVAEDLAGRYAVAAAGNSFT